MRQQGVKRFINSSPTVVDDFWPRSFFFFFFLRRVPRSNPFGTLTPIRLRGSDGGVCFVLFRFFLFPLNKKSENKMETEATPRTHVGAEGRRRLGLELERQRHRDGEVAQLVQHARMASVFDLRQQRQRLVHHHTCESKSKRKRRRRRREKKKWVETGTERRGKKKTGESDQWSTNQSSKS